MIDVLLLLKCSRLKSLHRYTVYGSIRDPWTDRMLRSIRIKKGMNLVGWMFEYLSSGQGILRYKWFQRLKVTVWLTRRN